jgi:hypothetical protein
VRPTGSARPERNRCFMGEAVPTVGRGIWANSCHSAALALTSPALEQARRTTISAPAGRQAVPRPHGRRHEDRNRRCRGEPGRQSFAARPDRGSARAIAEHPGEQSRASAPRPRAFRATVPARRPGDGEHNGLRQQLGRTPLADPAPPNGPGANGRHDGQPVFNRTVRLSRVNHCGRPNILRWPAVDRTRAAANVRRTDPLPNAIDRSRRRPERPPRRSAAIDRAVRLRRVNHGCRPNVVRPPAPDPNAGRDERSPAAASEPNAVIRSDFVTSPANAQPFSPGRSFGAFGSGASPAATNSPAFAGRLRMWMSRWANGRPIPFSPNSRQARLSTSD